MDPGAEGERGRHELQRFAVAVAALVPQRAAEVLVNLREADTTQVYARIRPAHLKQSVASYEGKALEALTK